MEVPCHSCMPCNDDLPSSNSTVQGSCSRALREHCSASLRPRLHLTTYHYCASTAPAQWAVECVYWQPRLPIQRIQSACDPSSEVRSGEQLLTFRIHFAAWPGLLLARQKRNQAQLNRDHVRHGPSISLDQSNYQSSSRFNSGTPQARHAFRDNEPGRPVQRRNS